MTNGQYTGRKWIPDELAARLYGYRYLRQDGADRLPERTDLSVLAPLLVADNETDGVSELSLDPVALIPAVPTNRTVYVDPVNGDDGTGAIGELTFPFLTIAAAISEASGAAPLESDPVLISVHPGTYSEVPLTIPSYVTLASVGGCGTTIIQASTATSPLVTGSAASAIAGFCLKGASGVGGIGARYADLVSSPPGRFNVSGCRIEDCETGLRQEGSGAFVYAVRNKFAKSGSMARAIVSVDTDPASGGGILVLLSEISGGPGDNLSQAVVSDNSLVRFGAQLIVSFADSGLYTENNGIIIGTDISCATTTNPFHISASSGTISVGTFAIIGEGAILVQSPTGSLITGSGVHSSEPVVASGAEWFGLRFDETQQTAVIEGSLRVGSAGRPGVTALGGGGIHTAGLRALWNDNIEAGTWTDVTDDILSASGSAIDLVPGLGTANSFFLGSDIPLPGAYFDVALAQVGGTLTPYYWNGAAWVAIPRWMTTEAAAPYASSANAMFAASGQQDIRFSALPGDTAKALNGVTKYWYSWQVTSGLTTAPRIEQAKLHTHHSRFAADGTLLYYGDARPVVPFEVDLELWSTGGGSAPTAATVSYSANVTTDGLRNFTNSVQRSIGRDLPLPRQVDTSALIDLTIEGYLSNASALNVDTELHYVRVPPNSLLNGSLPGEQTLAVSLAGPGVANQAITFAYSLALDTAVAGTDRVAMTFERLSTDANTGDLEVSKIQGSYRAWRS